MRKLLLSLSALALSLSLNAQTAVLKAQGLSAQKNTQVSQRVVSLSALRAAKLSANQRLLGHYTTDNLAEYGLGIPNYGANDNCKAASYITNDMLAPFAGKKIVAIRFGLCASTGDSRVFITPITQSGIGSDVVSKTISSTVADWNTVTLDTPYEITNDASRDLFIGFDFKQKATKSGNYYTDDCYPLSLVEEGEYQNLYVYTNISAASGGSGEGWYNFGNNYGNISIQAIVEGDFADYSVTPSDFSKITCSLGDEVSVPVEFYNFSKEAVTSLDYVVTVDGVAGEEQHVSLSDAVAMGSYGVFYTKVAAGDVQGEKNVKIEITKVNGEVNAAEDKVCEGSITVVSEVYSRNVLVEEMTTEKCGNCPRVAGYLHTALKTADRTRVYAVCHHAGYYSDWLSNGDIDSYGGVKAGTGWDGPLLYLFDENGYSSFAPAVTFNRSYHSDYSTSNTAGCFTVPSSATEITKHCKEETDQTANAKLYINVTPNEEGTQATVVVCGVTNGGIDKENTFLTFYLTEDSVKAKSQSGASGAYYQMHVIRYSNAVGNFGDEVEWNDDNSFTKTFTVALDSKWVKSRLYFVALLDHRNAKNIYDNKVENVIGTPYKDLAAIKGVSTDAQNVVVARYNAAGQLINAPQKGLNIVKMSNGKTYKEIVK